ncbi:MAG: BatA domain-containing protein, partial [Gemmataceae bacterium]
MAPLFAFAFASPLAALMAVVGAVSVPIIIHLLNRRRFKVITWAAMRFLLAAQRKNTRRMHIEQIVLLAVRCLIVAMLVIAMAGVMPWAEEFWAKHFPSQVVKAAPGMRRTHKIFVIDGSFSMATRLGEKNCFERAKELAVDLVNEGQGGDGFSVVLMSAPARPIVNEPSDNAAKVVEEIESLQLPHGNADVVGMLNTVDSMLGRSPAKFEEKEVYFLTDLQRSTWTARQTVDPLAAIQRIQSRARTIFVDVGRDGINNLAITGVSLAAPLAMTGSVTPISVMLHNYAAEPRDGVRIELLIGRARLEPNDAPFELLNAGQTVLSVAPSQTLTVNFPYKFGSPGDYLVQVRLSTDDLPLDDVRQAVIRVKDTVPVMLVNGKPAVELYDTATEFLFDALNPFQKGLVPRDIPARPRILTETQFSDAGLGDLTGYDCVFLCDVARLSQAEIRRLELHVRNGGGVVFCLGPRVDQEAYNRLLYRDGKGLLPVKLVGRQRAEADTSFIFHAEEESFRLPPLDAFAADIDRAALTGARFQQYVRVEVAPQARKVLSFVPQATKAGAIVAKTGQEPAVIEWHPPLAPAEGEEGKPLTRSARGRVIVLTTTANMDWTTWPVSPSYPALMQEILRFAIAGKLREQSSLVGEMLESYLPLGNAGLDVAVTLPDKRQETTQTRSRDDGSVFTWSDTSTSGIYKAVVGQLPEEHLFAVNVPTATLSQQACESDLARTNREELRSTYQGWD